MKVGQIFIWISIPRKEDEEENCDENVIPPKLFHKKPNKKERKKRIESGNILETEMFGKLRARKREGEEKKIQLVLSLSHNIQVPRC